MRLYLKAHIRDHPFLPTRRHLNPLFLEIEFIPNLPLRARYRLKAEEFTRQLARKHAARSNLPLPSNGLINLDEIDTNSLQRTSFRDTEMVPNTVGNSPLPKKGVQKGHLVFSIVLTFNKLAGSLWMNSLHTTLYTWLLFGNKPRNL